MKRKLNRVAFDPDAIIDIVKQISLSSYGIVDFALKGEIKHISNLTKKGKKENAIFIYKSNRNNFKIDAYLVIAPSVKISETLAELQKAIKYQLDKKFPKCCKSVNLFAQRIA